MAPRVGQRCRVDAGANALERFGTRLEHRMSRVEIAAAMERAGLRDIRFSESVPFWCAVG